MSRSVILDAGPLGLVTNPNNSEKSRACLEWLRVLLSAGQRVIVPEIADYEVRRELLRADKRRGIARLDRLCASLEYVPITTVAMRRAAELWAQARRSGRPTAADNTIDADMILIAQTLTCGADDSVIATTNVGHLSRFHAAQLWPNVTPS